MTHSSSEITEKQKYITKVVMPAIVSIITLSEDKIKLISDRLETKGRYHFFPKNAVIEYPGNFEGSHAWAVIKGYVRSYVYDFEKGKEITTHIWKKNDVIISSDCYIEKNQRIHYVAMMEDGYVFSLHYQDLEQLIFEYPELRVVFDRLQSNRERMHNRILEWTRLSTIEMLKMLLKFYPRIDGADKSNLASFLNRSREDLTRNFKRYYEHSEENNRTKTKN